MKRRIAAICALLALCTAGMLTGCGEVEQSRDTPAETKAEKAAESSEAEASEEVSSESEVSSEAEEESSEEASKEEASSAAEENSEADAESIQAEESSTADSKADDAAYDFTGMSGYWYIDGDYNTAYIHITKEGSFTSYYASGSEECSGKIVREIDSRTENYVFNLYNEDEAKYLTFADDGESEKTDLYSVSEYSVHFVKLYGEGGLGDDGRDPNEDDYTEGEEFYGMWGCGRAGIEISKTDGEDFHIFITWGDSAFASVEWDYTGEYQNGKLICDKNGAKIYVEYTDAASEPKRTVEYTEGSAEFELHDGKLYWNDKEENAAEGMEFIK